MRSSNARPLSALLCSVVAACSARDTSLVDSRKLDADTLPNETDAAMADAAPTFRFDDAGVVLCGPNRACACSDDKDNDGDHLVDGLDPECTGAFDDFEDSFATGLHGEEQTSKRQDCFYDTNSGGGDGCGRPRCCSEVDPITPGNSQCRACAVDARCSETCLPLVPNGCDCFGCCGVWRAGVVSNVLLGNASCTLAALDKCTRCIPAPDCQNPCGACELCPGRGLADLPLTCAGPNGPVYACEDSQLCQDSATCGTLGYCQNGCCITIGI